MTAPGSAADSGTAALRKLLRASQPQRLSSANSFRRIQERLIGQMNWIEVRDKTEKQKERQALKKSLRVIRAEVNDKAPEEDAT
jgi:thiamine monophosphate synthase